ncbi:podocalyxin [Salmo salar]|uniref:Podocalyxin n=1 Tax=Salmo salar TaxID=8030 RepID=A0A1S3SGV4_SALSA|nr:podocalyxin [Salmo salar]|eukprot:XP_014063564.1 PREDICTED: podocalyxin [Salmo salar]
METKMRITWALIPLGFLLHCTHADPTPSKSSDSMENTRFSTATLTSEVATSTIPPTLISEIGTAPPNLTVPTVAALSTSTSGRSSGNVMSTTITAAGTGFTSSSGTPTETTTQFTGFSGTPNQTPAHSTSSSGATTQITPHPTSSSGTPTQTTAHSTSSSGTSTQITPQPTSSSGTPTQIATHSTSSSGTPTQTTPHSTSSSGTPTQTTPHSNNSSGTPTQTTRHSTSSSGTPTQTPPHSTTAFTRVGGGYSPTLTIPWSRLSSPSQQPSTSSPVGSGSSFAFTTTRAKGGMVLTTTAETTTTMTTTKSFTFVMPKGNEENHERKDLERKDLEALCRHLMSQMQDANCTLTVSENNGHTTFDSVVVTGKVNNSVVQQYYEEITRKPSDNMTLIAILASCGALLAMIVGFALYAAYHRKSYRKNHQQHLTEEMQTVENGYHDNPTLEVMEVQPEMQEKKVALNGEFNDSWIVPIDNLLKEDMPDEEDTHL